MVTHKSIKNKTGSSVQKHIVSKSSHVYAVETSMVVITRAELRDYCSNEFTNTHANMVIREKSIVSQINIRFKNISIPRTCKFKIKYKNVSSNVKMSKWQTRAMRKASDEKVK